jgi:hypothetical protein
MLCRSSVMKKPLTLVKCADKYPTMKPTYNDKLIAYLTLISGLAISGVAEYYSIMGLIAIYPAAFWPIVIMGVALGLGKITGTVWLKQNWDYAPFFLKTYILPAIVVLMVITSLGVFGFLSKAHSDQSLVSGDVLAKIAVYDEKIKTSKDNIDANRKALKQMDEAVDQSMARSTDEKGADKAVAIRRGQAKERTRLLNEITAEQKAISKLSEEAAPIRAEVRKVEAEVGPIKYIAHLLYGENPDANILEKAVIWVTVLIVTVLDPLAVILLLASQYSFQRFRQSDEEEYLLHETVPHDSWVADVGEKPTAEEKAEGDSPTGPVVDIVSPDTTVTQYEADDGPLTNDQIEQLKEKSILEQHPYLNEPFSHFTGLTPMVHKPDPVVLDDSPTDIDAWNKMLEEAEKAIEQEVKVTQTEEGTVVEDAAGTTVIPAINDPLGNYERPGEYITTSTYVQNEEQKEDNTLWKDISVVSETQYLEAARKHQIEVFAEQVVANVLPLENISADLKDDVLAQIEQMKTNEDLKKDDIINSLVRQVRGELLTLDQIPFDLRDQVKERLQ